MNSINWQPVKAWGIFEYTPSPEGDIKRCIIIRETYGEANLILQSLEDTNRNFDMYKIEGITEERK